MVFHEIFNHSSAELVSFFVHEPRMEAPCKLRVCQILMKEPGRM